MSAVLPKDVKEQKLTGIAAEELRNFGKAVKIFEDKILERKLLGSDFRQQAFSAATRVLHRAIELYGKRITSATVSVAADGIASLWGGGILGEFKALEIDLATDSEIEKALNELAKAIALEAKFPEETPSLSEEERKALSPLPIDRAQAVLRSLQVFVQGVRADTPAIRLPKDAKALAELKKAPTPALLVPALDIKPFEAAFPLIISGWEPKPPSEKEEAKKTPEEKAAELKEQETLSQQEAEEFQRVLLLSVFFQPLQAVGEQWRLLLEQCIDPKKAFLPKEALDVMDAFLSVYEKVEQEVFSHTTLLSWVPAEFIEPYRQAIPRFREDVRQKLTAWRKTFAEQQALLAKSAQERVLEVAELKRKMDAEQKHQLPEDKAGLSLQIQALEEQIDRLETQADRLEQLAEQEEQLSAQAQARLPAVHIDWQILAPGSVVGLSRAVRASKLAFAIDCQSEFHQLYQQVLKGQTNAASLKEQYESILERVTEARTALLNTKKEQYEKELGKARGIAAGWIADKQKVLEEKEPADLFQAYAHLTRLIAEAKTYQSKGVDELSALIQGQCSGLTPAECRESAQRELDSLGLAERIPALEKRQGQIKQALLGQADEEIKAYIQKIEAELVPPSAADLKEEKEEKLETALARLEAEIKVQEARLGRLRGLEEKLAQDLNAELAKFSAVLTDQERGLLIRQASGALGIEQRHKLQEKHLEALTQPRYELQMRIIAQSGDAKSLGAEYKKIKEKIEWFEKEEKRLSAQIPAEEKKLEALDLDQEDRVSEKAKLRQELTALQEREKKLAAEIAVLKPQQTAAQEQSQADLKEIQRLERRIAELGESIPKLERSCDVLNEEIGACKTQIRPMKPRDNQYSGFTTGSPEELKKLTAKLAELQTQKDSVETELETLQKEQQNLAQQLQALRARQAQDQSRLARLNPQVQALEQTQADIKSYRELTARVSAGVDRSVEEHRKTLETQAANIAKLKAELAAAPAEREKLAAQNEKTKAQLKEVLEKQFALQTARVKELGGVTASILDEIRSTRHRVIEADKKAGMPMHRHVPAVFAALLSEKAFEKRKVAQEKLNGLRTLLRESKAAAESARQEFIELDVDGVDEGSSLSLDPFDEAEDLLKQFEKDFEGQYNVGETVLELAHSSLVANDSPASAFDESEIDLWLALLLIESQQKKFREGLLASEQKLALVQEPPEIKGGDAKALTLEAKSQGVASLIQAAEALRQAASVDIPRFSTDPWFAGLASIEASLAELEKQGGEAASFAKAVREKIAKTKAQRDKIIQEEAALAEKSRAAIQKAQEAAASALQPLQAELATHKEQLQTARQALEKREADLKSAMVELAAAENMAPEARLAAAKKLMDVIGGFEQKAISFSVWAEASLASLDTHLARAKQLQPELVASLEKEMAEVRALQAALPLAQKALEDIVARGKEKAGAAHEKAYSDRIKELAYYQKCVASWLADFEKQRADEHFWQDGFEWVIFGLLYILTLTLVDIQTEKAQVHEKVEAVNKAFETYVKDVQEQEVQAVDKPKPEVSYGVLMGMLVGTDKQNSSKDSAEKSGTVVQLHLEASAVKSSHFLPKGGDRLEPRLQVVGEVAEKFSPRKMGLGRG